jgi:hypothetical protein
MPDDGASGGDFRLPRRAPPPRAYFGGFARRPEAHEVTTYMRGYCAYFALAMHEEFGHQLVDMAVHIAVMDGEGAFWDIRGRMTESEVRDGIGAQVRITPTTEADVIELIAPGLMSDGPFSKRRLHDARALVRELAVAPAWNDGIDPADQSASPLR